MKKALCLVITVVLISAGLFACNKAESKNSFLPAQTFSLHMQAQKNQKAFEADINCLSANEITLSFTSPKELSGFTVTTSENGFSVNVFGLPDEISSEELNKSALINILTKAIKISVFMNHGLFKEADGKFSADITIDNIPVSVIFTNDGFLSEIKCESIGFFALFQKSG